MVQNVSHFYTQQPMEYWMKFSHLKEICCYLFIFFPRTMLRGEKGHSNKIGNTHWHFIDLCGVELFDITQNSHIIVSDKIDRHSLATKPT